MSEIRRKLGWKNYRLFIVLTLIVVFVVILFVISIVSTGQHYEMYYIAAGSTMLDKDYNVITLGGEGRVSRSFNGNYVLDTISENKTEVRYDLGRNAVAYSDNDYKFYLFGQAYLIGNDNSVKKIEQYEEISKATPAFYKLGDRKYFLADKKIESKEISLNTHGYLIVELDKQGNATLVNNEVNFKTINPVIIKGTYYDFDVAREKLKVGDKEIDLTNIIGTTNEYEDEKEDDAEDVNKDGGGTDGEEESSYVAGDTSTKYYDEYIKRIKNSFNNLYSGTNRLDDTLGIVEKKSNVILDLTRWTKLTSAIADPTYITINYSVFDPNNEYAQIFIDVRERGSDRGARYILSKDESSYTVRGLSPDKKYEISYGYTLARVVDESQTEVFVDSVVVVTPSPSTSVRISKITTNRIYYVLELDKGYEISQAVIQFVNDGEVVSSVGYDSSMANGFVYEGSFGYESLGRVVEVRVVDMLYNGTPLDGTVTGIYINQ